MTAPQLKKLRARLGLDQVALARRLGVHPMTVSRWERGVIRIPKATAELLKIWAATKQGDQR